MEETPKPIIPKKACTLDIMFSIEDDRDALAIKEKIDAIVKDIENKRFRFQIIET